MKYRKFSNICFNIPYSNSAIPNSTNLSIEMNNLTHNILHKGWCGTHRQNTPKNTHADAHKLDSSFWALKFVSVTVFILPSTSEKSFPD